LKELLRAAFSQFEKNQIATVDAELLLAYLLGVSRKQIHSQSIELSESEREKISSEFNELIQQRLLGRPVQYITGSAAFRYLELEVGEGVLIPRPETELIVDRVIGHLSSQPDKENSKSIIELGAGSGAISIAIATDPPYIPNDEKLPIEVENFEPEMALRGGAVDGMQVPKLFIDAATRLLKSGGFFITEHHEKQGELIRGVLARDFLPAQTHADLTGRDRFTSAIKR